MMCSVISNELLNISHYIAKLTVAYIYIILAETAR